MANMTITKAKELVGNPEQFELLTVEEVAEVAEVLNGSKAKDAEKFITMFGKLMKERKEIAPKEEVAELVVIENSVKIKSGATKVNAEAVAKADTKVKKFVPKAKKPVEAPPVVEAKAEVVEDDSEEAIHIALANEINEANIKELRAIALDHSVKIPGTLKSNDKIRAFLKEEIIGYDVLGENEAEEVEEEAPALAFETIEYKNLSKAVQENPYQVLAYVTEKGQAQPSVFTVLFANKEIVVLLDSTIVKNSVITADKSHFSKNGTILSLDDNLCPVAFLVPSK